MYRVWQKLSYKVEAEKMPTISGRYLVSDCNSDFEINTISGESRVMSNLASH